MIGLFGLFAALFAGMMADNFLGQSDLSGQSDPNDPPPGDPVPETLSSDLGATDSGDFMLGGTHDGMPQSSDTPQPPPQDQTMTGTDGADVLFGDAGQDQVWGGEGDDALGGRGGDDSISAGAGNDQVYGGDGNDQVFAGDGMDTVYGEAGNDIIVGEGGNDVIYAGPGQDDLSGGAGNDQVFGGQDNDTLSGNQGDDTLDGGLGDDVVLGGAGADDVDGGDGNDTIWGQSAGIFDTDADTLNGGAGNDQLMLGQGDLANGGQGEDTFNVTDYGAAHAEIVDFDPALDHLVIQYDSQQITDPQVSIQTGSGGETIVLLNGGMVASLSNGAALQADQVSLRPM